MIDIVQLDTTSANGYNNHTLNVKLNAMAKASFNGPLMGQVALVEDPVAVKTSPTTTVSYRDVVRKLLLGSEGVMSVNVNIGDPIQFTKQNIEVDVQIADPANLHLVAWVQNFTTREILQSFKMPLGRKKGRVITAIEDPAKITAAMESVIIYPNPANGKFNFGLPGDFPPNCVWKISDQRGVIVKSGDFDDALNGSKTVDVSSLVNGVYIVAIGTTGGNSVYRKLVVLNSN
jgi:hypothetical protein